MAGRAQAATAEISFSGPGVSGALVLTYGAATDAKYPNAYEVTVISGTFTDTNNSLAIVNAPVEPLVAINHAVVPITSRMRAAIGITNSRARAPIPSCWRNSATKAPISA
jgi:hypothetical protein